MNVFLTISYKIINNIFSNPTDAFSDQPWAAQLMFLLACVSCLMSLYLAFILLVVLKDICVVCFATYALNAMLFVATRQVYMAT